MSADKIPCLFKNNQIKIKVEFGSSFNTQRIVISNESYDIALIQYVLCMCIESF